MFHAGTIKALLHNVIIIPIFEYSINKGVVSKENVICLKITSISRGCFTNAYRLMLTSSSEHSRSVFFINSNFSYFLTHSRSGDLFDFFVLALAVDRSVLIFMIRR